VHNSLNINEELTLTIKETLQALYSNAQHTLRIRVDLFALFAAQVTADRLREAENKTLRRKPTIRSLYSNAQHTLRLRVDLSVESTDGVSQNRSPG